jgi:DNA-binding transcriptional ArsR family regulator
VAIKQKLKPLVDFIYETLFELGIRSQITKDGSKWLLRITSYSNFIKFRDKVNFSKGYRKRDGLNKMISKIKYPRFEIKNQILELLKKSPKTRREIAKLVDKSEAIVYGHLHGWKRKAGKKVTTEGLVDKGLVSVEKKGRRSVYVFNRKDTTIIN